MLVSLEVNFTLSTKLEEIHLAISLIETNLEGGRDGWDFKNLSFMFVAEMHFGMLCVYPCCCMYTTLFINIDINK